MPRCAFLTLDDATGFVIDDEMAYAPLAALGWRVEAVSWRTPSPDWGAYDAVVIRSTWDYIADPRSRLKKIHGMTKGTFLSAWPRAETWRAPVRKVRLSILGCPVYFFRHDEVHALLKEAGFAIKSEEVIGQLYCVEATTPT